MIQPLQRFVSELHRRKVLRVASAYVVGAWIVLQVAVALQTAMSLSASFSAAILALLVIGFPASLVLTWFFEITPEGIKRTLPATGDGTLVKPQTTDLILAGALGLVVIVAVAQFLMPSPTAPPAAAPTTTTAATPPAKSIAVLPFANLSPDKDDAYFADGLTEEILNILARLRGVRVISRTSSFAFKGKDTPLPEIAKQLGVRHVLEGSVRRSGESLRISAQLIDVASDAHVWSETFERKLADVFTVQDEIARAIAGALNIELSLSAGARGAPTTNIEAYRLYLQARERTQVISKESLLEGLELYNRAITLDPKFADAYAGAAAIHAGLRLYDPSRTPELRKQQREAVETALRLNPNSATAYAVLAGLAVAARDWEGSMQSASRAVELEPSNSLALGGLGNIQMRLGFVEKAARTIEETARVDPLYSLGGLRLILVAFASGDNATLAEHAMKLQSAKGLAGFNANCSLAFVAKEKGDSGAAVDYFRTCAKVWQAALVVEPVTHALKDSAWRDRAVKALHGFAGRNLVGNSEVLYLLVGATDEFLDAMVRRLEAKSGAEGMSDVYYASIWRLVARGEGNNPKLKAVPRKAGLVDYWRKHGWPDRCRAKGEDDFECS